MDMKGTGLCVDKITVKTSNKCYENGKIVLLCSSNHLFKAFHAQDKEGNCMKISWSF